MCRRSEHDLRISLVIVATVAFFTALVQLTACFPKPALLGSAVPTAYTFKLADSDLEEAQRRDCEPLWYTGDPIADVDTAFLLLKENGIRVKHWNPLAGATSMPKTLYLRKDFDERTREDQAILLRHELTHYCDRTRLKGEFDLRYLHSAGRWVFETRAYVQSVRGMVAAKWRMRRIEQSVKNIVAEMRDEYFLHDIDPTQFEEETTRILMDAAHEADGLRTDEIPEDGVGWP